MSADAPLLSLRGVSKTFGAQGRALAGLDLDLARGEFLSLIGPSGCGKSTALRLIAGLIAPDAGALEWAGGVRPEIGFVFQAPTLTPWADARTNVWLPLRLQGVSWRRARGRVEAALERVGLADRARAYPRELSGGMAMRVSIARALVAEPSVLLMDEPFAALDEITRFRLNDDLARIVRESGASVVFVTHSIFESVYLSSRVAVFSPAPGRIVETLAVDSPQPRSADFRLTPLFSLYARRLSDALVANEARA